MSFTGVLSSDCQDEVQRQEEQSILASSPLQGTQREAGPVWSDTERLASDLVSLLFWPCIQQLLIGHPLCMEPGCSDIASVSLENIGHQQPHYHLPPSLGIGSWDPPAQDL